MLEFSDSRTETAGYSQRNNQELRCRSRPNGSRQTPLQPQQRNTVPPTAYMNRVSTKRRNCGKMMSEVLPRTETKTPLSS